jgi:N utilization substance protein B
MGRRASREAAMKLLYQMEIQKDNKEDQINTTIDEGDFKDKDKVYLIDVVEGVNKNIKDIDDIIKIHAKGWKINRISKVDLSILRLSVFELLYRDDIPNSVSINEAVELAKKFSSDDASSFINGILSKVANIKTLQSDS